MLQSTIQELEWNGRGYHFTIRGKSLKERKLTLFFGSLTDIGDFQRRTVTRSIWTKVETYVATAFLIQAITCSVPARQTEK